MQLRQRQPINYEQSSYNQSSGQQYSLPSFGTQLSSQSPLNMERMKQQALNLQQIEQNDLMWNNQRPEMFQALYTPNFTTMKQKLYPNQNYEYAAPKFIKPTGKIATMDSVKQRLKSVHVFPKNSPIVNSWHTQLKAKTAQKTKNVYLQALYYDLKRLGLEPDEAVRQEGTINQLITQGKLNSRYKDLFSYSNGTIIFKPPNPEVRKMFQVGQITKSAPTMQQYQQAVKHLKSTYVDPARMQGQLAPAVGLMLQNCQRLGFNPHFGPVSKNGKALYIGAWIDPLTGRIRLPPKPETKYVNPTDRQSVLEYETLKAMYMWNSMARAEESLQNTTQMSSAQWSSKVKQKRKGWNPVLRARDQFKDTYKKLISGQPFYNVNANDAQYQQTLGTLNNPRSTPTQMKNSIKNLVKYSQNLLRKQLADYPQEFGKSLQLNAAMKYDNRPVTGAQASMQKSLLRPRPLGKTSRYVMAKDDYGQWINDMIQENVNKQFVGMTSDEAQASQLQLTQSLPFLFMQKRSGNPQKRSAAQTKLMQQLEGSDSYVKKRAKYFSGMKPANKNYLANTLYQSQYGPEQDGIRDQVGIYKAWQQIDQPSRTIRMQQQSQSQPRSQYQQYQQQESYNSALADKGSMSTNNALRPMYEQQQNFIQQAQMAQRNAQAQRQRQQRQRQMRRNQRLAQVIREDQEQERRFKNRIFSPQILIPPPPPAPAPAPAQQILIKMPGMTGSPAPAPPRQRAGIASIVAKGAQKSEQMRKQLRDSRTWGRQP